MSNFSRTIYNWDHNYIMALKWYHRIKALSSWTWMLLFILVEEAIIVSSQSIESFPASPFIQRTRTTNISLTCNATNDFVPGNFGILAWSKDDVPLTSNSKLSEAAKAYGRMKIEVVDKSYTLVISSPDCSDEGNYKCKVETVAIDTRSTDVHIGNIDKSAIVCDPVGSHGLRCRSNTNPNATLQLSWNSKSVWSNATSADRTVDTNCNETFPNSVEAYETESGKHTATLNVYFADETNPDYPVYTVNHTFTVESTTTTESTTGGPVPSTTPVTGPPPPPQGLSTGAIVGIVIGSVVGLALIILLIIYLVIEYCPCSCCPSSNGNVPYEFEIDGVKEDKTIEISPGILIRLAATCYGAKPPASIQWCISYNGKDPMDMTEKDYGNSDALNTSVTTNKRDPKTSDTHSKLEMVPNEDHDGAVIYCVAITKISADEEKWDLKTSPKITLKLKKGQVGDYPGQVGFYQGQGGDYRQQGGDYRGQDGYHQGHSGNYGRHGGQAGQEYQPHGNTRNDKDPFPQPGKRPNALEPIQGQRTLTPIGDIEKTSFKKKRQTNKQTSEL